MQILSVLGQLVGLRLLTELLSPGAFGEINLWLGGVALIASGLANPTMQALLRFYPEYAMQNQAGLARTVANQQLLKLCAYLSPIIVLLLIISITQYWLSWPVVLVFVLLAVMEMTRMQNLAVLNAIRSQRAAGLWQVLESWLRPLLACIVILWLGENQSLILAAFFVASLLVWYFMRSQVPATYDLADQQEYHNKVSNRFWQYTLPLLPLGIFGWVSGMGDRYIIAGMMSAADVGIYVAAYGLASRPITMLAGIIETTIRPAYHYAVINNNKDEQHGLLWRWVGILALGSLAVFSVAYFAHNWIAYFLLGEDFRSGSYFIPWLVLGHILMAFSQLLIRIQYARENTKAVAIIEISAALVAITSSYFLIQFRGLEGAVFAVIIGYAAQLVIAFFIFNKDIAYKKSSVK